MVWELFSYPLQVITTNRIVESQLSKQGANSLSRELNILTSEGLNNRGLARGLLPFLLYEFGSPLVARGDTVIAAAGAVAFNPFSIMAVKKQVYGNNKNVLKLL